MLIFFKFPSFPRAISFFFNDTATTEIYTLSLHDALPISRRIRRSDKNHRAGRGDELEVLRPGADRTKPRRRSEEHTSELQSPDHLVCRLLLEKKKESAMNCASNASAIRRAMVHLPAPGGP